MKNEVFRQKNIDKINSPESLNDYVKVTNPSVWIILIGIIVLLIGAATFAILGKVDTNVNVAVCVSDGEIIAYLAEENMEKVTPDMKVIINGEEYSIKSVSDKPIKNSEIDEYALHKANIESATWLYPLKLDGSLSNGVYKGYITVEKVSPMSYLFN